MKEEEARGLFCPLKVVVVRSTQTPLFDSLLVKCQGRECMAWSEDEEGQGHCQLVNKGFHGSEKEIMKDDF
jgi:hypothetical protein